MEISKRLEHFTRIKCIGVQESSCFLLTVWSNEVAPRRPYNKRRSTTIQRSGKTSRYTIIPKKVCERFHWHTGTELVIGFSYELGRRIYDTLYKDDDFFPQDDTRPEVLVIMFQRYHDIKETYREKLAERRAFLEKHEEEMLWKTRHDGLAYERAMARIDNWKKEMRKAVWDELARENCIAVSYVDYLKLRADSEREKKKIRRRERKRRQGTKATWDHRKNLVRGYGTDWDARCEALLDDPDTLNEMRTEDPETYSQDGLTNRYGDDANDEDRGL